MSFLVSLNSGFFFFFFWLQITPLRCRLEEDAKIECEYFKLRNEPQRHEPRHENFRQGVCLFVLICHRADDLTTLPVGLLSFEHEANKISALSDV